MENTFNQIFLSYGFSVKKKYYKFKAYYNKEKNIWGQVDEQQKTIELNNRSIRYSIIELITELNKLN